MQILIMYNSKNEVMGLFMDLEYGKKTSEELGYRWEIRHTVK